MIDSFRGRYGFLSNFYRHARPIRLLDGSECFTVEHAFQAMKTHDPGERRRIVAAKTPGKAKALGRRATLRPDWDREKLGIMREVLRLKFQNNPELKDKLLETGDAELIEGNTWGDTFWGVCRGRGENHLGKLLMELRGDFTIDAVARS